MNLSTLNYYLTFNYVDNHLIINNLPPPRVFGEGIFVVLLNFTYTK